jgi:outer membrane protein OmpA-like peptidoglycan-associated protein
LVYSTSLYALVATATSGLPVTFSSASTGICSISGSNLTLLSVGICSITASQPGNSSYAAAAVVIAGIQITPAPQTITFASIGSALQVPGTETLVANASSNLPVTFTTASAGICSVAGDILSAMSAGSCVVVASQAGGGNWQAAEPKTQTISITISTDPPARVTPHIVPSNVTPIISGTTPQLGRPIVLPVTRVRNPFIPTKRFSVSAKLSDRVTNYATVTQLTGKLTLIHIPHDAGTKLRLNSGVANSVAGRLKLNVTTDGLEVTALNGWTGRISIPVIATVNGVEIELWIAVVEIPGVVISPLFYFNTQNKVTVNWAPDGSQVLAYNLYLDNSPICTTSQTSCTLTTIATPVTAHSNLLIEAIGRQATYSLKIAPVFVTKRVLTAEVVHFATSSSALAPSDSRSLTSFAQAAINLGAKTVQIAGFTDTAGNSAINRPLSIARANVVAAYLKKLLPHFKFIIKGNSSGMPVSSNNSANGRANNRRVEVTVA